jgi:hypothetical protein
MSYSLKCYCCFSGFGIFEEFNICISQEVNVIHITNNFVYF